MKFLSVFYLFALTLLFTGCGDDGGGAADPVTHSVSELVPSTGIKGTVVLVKGSGFEADTSRMKVFFNDRIAQVLTATASQLTVVVPAGAGPGFVTVSKDGTTVGGPYFDFIYTATVSTFSGSVEGYADGPSSSARFSRPRGLAIDLQGNLVVADEGNQRIRVVFPNGSVNTLTGSGLTGHSDGAPSSARFNQPYDVAVDLVNQEYYVADKGNHCIRKVTFSGNVSTVAGIPATPGYVDGAATAARLNGPTGVAWRGEQLNVYIADGGNHCIRNLDNSGILSTFAGANAIGFSDGTGTSARFNTPFDITWDTTGYFYVTDLLNNNIRRITLSGEVFTLAGSGAAGFADGPSVLAEFFSPQGISGYMGRVLLCDADNNRVRMVSGQTVSTLAGTGAAGNGNGDGSIATFTKPGGIVRDKEGNYYISDTENHLIRKIVLD
jgi:hypothetical protein